MSLFLLKRLATLIGTLIGASVIVFLVLEILPGNAAQLLMGPDAAPEAVAALATKLGLDQPAWTRYWHWIGGILTGNLGDSYAYSSPVLDLILERLALTVPLALLAMALTTVLALLVGVTAAARHNKLGDVGLMSMAQVGIAIPNFWFAILLILVFSVNLQWFSAGGFDGWGEGIGGVAAGIIAAPTKNWCWPPWTASQSGSRRNWQKPPAWRSRTCGPRSPACSTRAVCAACPAPGPAPCTGWLTPASLTCPPAH